MNIGTRQAGREHGPNVVHVDHDAGKIEAVAHMQIAHGPSARNDMFGDGKAGQRIADILREAVLGIQKRLSYSFEDSDAHVVRAL